MIPPAPTPAFPLPVLPRMDVEELHETTEETTTRWGEAWRVLLFNDEVHTFDEVIFQVMKATGVSPHKAFKVVMEAHRKGKAVAFEGEFETCFDVQNVLREIGLVTEIEG